MRSTFPSIRQSRINTVMVSDMNKHENRRVRMTKRLMKDALLELLEKEELVNISVTAICKTADVHRSTFYDYYSDPADLLREIEQDFLDRIPVPPPMMDPNDQDMIIEASAAFFDYVKENAKTVRILFSGSSESSFSARMVDFLCSGYIPVSDDTDDTTARFIRLYIANGTVGMMREWINAGFPVSSRRLAEMMYFLSRKISSREIG